MTKSIIIDDEEGARESLANILQKYCPQIQVIEKASSLETGLKAIQKLQPELVFLDIELSSGTAFDLLERLDNIDFDIIFITAYDHYAIKAIKFSALDYLLKPIDIDELQSALEKYRLKKDDVSVKSKLKILFENMASPEASSKKIAVPDSTGLNFIQTEQIIRCESDGNYTLIVLDQGKKILSSKTLGEYDELLNEQRFLRVHRSHLINLDRIEKYVRGDGGYVIMKDGSEIEVSRRKKNEFLSLLNLG